MHVLLLLTLLLFIPFVMLLGECCSILALAYLDWLTDHVQYGLHCRPAWAMVYELVLVASQ